MKIKYEKIGEIRSPMLGEWFENIKGHPEQARFDFAVQKFPILRQVKVSNRSIPDEAVCFFRDGDKWCCVYGDFINLQESPAGFGNNFMEALDDLRKAFKEEL